MSYDLSLVIKTGLDSKVEVYSANYTSNIYKIYREAFAETGIDGIKNMFVDYNNQDFNTKSLPEIIHMVEKAVENMKNPSGNLSILKNDFYGSYWGTYEGALLFLENFLKAAKEHTYCYVELSV